VIKKITFFLEILSVSAYPLTGKMLTFEFYPKGVYFECKFWISRSAILLTVKPDRLDLRGLDLGKVTSKAHQLKMSACERSLIIYAKREF